MNPITAQLLKEARQEKLSNDPLDGSKQFKRNENNILKEDDIFGLGSSLSLISKGSNEKRSKHGINNNTSINNLYKKVLSSSLNSLQGGFENNNVKNSHSNLRNVATMNYSMSTNGVNENDAFDLPPISKIYNKVSDNVITFIQNQWKQSDGISATFQFLNNIREAKSIDNNCNDYLIKPLIEYCNIFIYISPSWLKKDETELNKIRESLQKDKDEKRFFVMPWNIEDKSINKGNPYWICIIYDKIMNKYIIFDTKNDDIHAYGVCLMIQSGILKYMLDITAPFYFKSLQEIIADKHQTTLETNSNHEGWKKIIICNSGLNHGDCGIDNVILANYFVQNYDKVFKKIIQNNMDYKAIKELLLSIKYLDFNTYIEKLFTISAIQYFNVNNMLC